MYNMCVVHVYVYKLTRLRKSPAQERKTIFYLRFVVRGCYTSFQTFCRTGSRWHNDLHFLTQTFVCASSHPPPFPLQSVCAISHSLICFAPYPLHYLILHDWLWFAVNPQGSYVKFINGEPHLGEGILNHINCITVPPKSPTPKETQPPPPKKNFLQKETSVREIQEY